MEVQEIIHIVGAVSFIGSGLGGLLLPGRFAQLLAVIPDGARGTAEIRVNIGGIFIGLGVMALVLNEAGGYQILGASMIGAGISRALAFFIDSPQLQPDYVAFFILEITIGVLMMA